MKGTERNGDKKVQSTLGGHCKPQGTLQNSGLVTIKIKHHPQAIYINLLIYINLSWQTENRVKALAINRVYMYSVITKTYCKWHIPPNE
jgi:hypothetical protein